jgi:beta-glucosidase
VPTIVILVGGRPLSINQIAEKIPAIIQAWEPGNLGGEALANIISGKISPSGKLPISVPRHAGQIQMIYNHKPSQYFHPYIDGPSTPLYSFGYGLSYSTFELSKPVLSKSIIDKSESITIEVSVKNTGTKDATDVVQLYIRDLYSSVTRPVKELKDFARVELKAGETKTVNLSITHEKLAFYNRNMNFVVESGDFEIMTGTSSLDKDLQKTILTVK